VENGIISCLRKAQYWDTRVAMAMVTRVRNTLVRVLPMQNSSYQHLPSPIFTPMLCSTVLVPTNPTNMPPLRLCAYVFGIRGEIAGIEHNDSSQVRMQVTGKRLQSNKFNRGDNLQILYHNRVYKLATSQPSYQEEMNR